MPCVVEDSTSNPSLSKCNALHVYSEVGGSEFHSYGNATRWQPEWRINGSYLEPMQLYTGLWVARYLLLHPSISHSKAAAIYFQQLITPFLYDNDVLCLGSASIDVSIPDSWSYGWRNSEDLTDTTGSPSDGAKRSCVTIKGSDAALR